MKGVVTKLPPPLEFNPIFIPCAAEPVTVKFSCTKEFVLGGVTEILAELLTPVKLAALPDTVAVPVIVQDAGVSNPVSGFISGPSTNP
jgi:hypothetical protein